MAKTVLQIPTLSDGSVPRRDRGNSSKYFAGYKKSPDGTANWNEPIYDTITMVDAAEFTEVLEFVSMQSHNRGAHVTMRNYVTGATYNVFQDDFIAMIPHMVNGAIKGTFGFKKRGQYIGLILIK